MSLDNNFLKKLEQIDSLPTLPVIAQKIQALITNERSNMAQIAAYISKDQAISSKVIKLVNSVFYSLRNRVTSIQQAIVLLGLNSVTNIVLGISIINIFSNSKSSLDFDRETFWAHTFATALGAKLIAMDLKRSEPEDYFLTGLLHDIGLLILDQFFHESFTDFLDYKKTNNATVKDAELAVFGATHQQIGEYVAMKWKLPSLITHTIRYHMEPFVSVVNTPERINDICMIVHIADISANNRGIHCGIPCGTMKIDQKVLDIVKLSEEKIDSQFQIVTIEVHALMKEWGV